ncbi:MAG TPA: hypothetical protein VMV50_01665 [Candidatus Paceibacterota bacterium]|nr:hypothetical protein [Candidatus Paceibacterota bacterium]
MRSASFIDDVRARWYRFRLDRSVRALPLELVADSGARADKESSAFRRYARELERYIAVLEDIRRRGPSFVGRFQELRLEKLLRRAAASAYWRSVFERSGVNPGDIRRLADLARIPPVGRTGLIDVPRDASATEKLPDNAVYWMRSSGSTTGTPFIWGSYAWDWPLAVWSYHLRELDARGFSLATSAHRDFLFQINYGGGNAVFQMFFIENFRLRPRGDAAEEDARAIVAAIEEVGPSVLLCNPTELASFLHALDALGRQPPMTGCLLVGQPIEEAFQEHAERLLGCPVIPYYSTMETAAIGAGCRHAPGRYHTYAERVIVEILDDAGRQVADGERGNITVTCLDNLFMPLIRYQPGDVGTLRHRVSCPCGNPNPLLEVEGRSVDVIRFADGSAESVRRVFKLLAADPFLTRIRRMQVRQEELGTLRILLEPRDAILGPAVIRELKKRIDVLYEGKIRVTVEEVREIDPGTKKFKAFVPLAPRTR